jgi:hypothetical protein
MLFLSFELNYLINFDRENLGLLLLIDKSLRREISNPLFRVKLILPSSLTKVFNKQC